MGQTREKDKFTKGRKKEVRNGNTIEVVTFQVLTAASMKFRFVFWDVPP
jgi:hypothetical protein